MKDVPAVKMPMPLADLAHPENWPLRGRNDHGEGMPDEAQFTPASNRSYPEPEEVTGDEESE